MVGYLWLRLEQNIRSALVEAWDVRISRLMSADPHIVIEAMSVSGDERLCPFGVRNDKV